MKSRFPLVIAAALVAVSVGLASAADPGPVQINDPRQPITYRCASTCGGGTNLLSPDQPVARDVAISNGGRYAAVLARPTPESGTPPLPVGYAGTWQIYLFDTKTHRLDLASRTLKGVPAAEGVDPDNGWGITADGRTVWFISRAGDLVPNDKNNNPDLFAYDRIKRKVTRLSVDISGKEIGAAFRGALSADGSTVFFEGQGDVFHKGATQMLPYWKNLKTGRGGVVTTSDGRPTVAGSNSPAYMLSDDGRYLLNTNDFLATLQGTFVNIYGLYDLKTGQWKALDATNGAKVGRASMDAKVTTLVFDGSSGLTKLDLATGTSTPGSVFAPGLLRPAWPSLSADGKTLAVRADGYTSPGLGSVPGIYVVDLASGQATLLGGIAVGCAEAGCAERQFGGPSLSRDGHAVGVVTDVPLTQEKPQQDWDGYVLSSGR